MSIDEGRIMRDATRIATIAATLFAGVFLLYGRVASFSFLRLDDPLYVTENVHVRGGLSGASFAWAFLAVGHAGNWHPLTWISHMLDAQLFGEWAGGHHLTSVGIHAAGAVALFFGLRALLVRASEISGARADWIAACVAGLFAFHPLRLESVAWVAERKDVLSTLFWNLGLAAYAAYSARRTATRYGWLALAFVLALLSKPMAVTFPLVLLLLDVWPLGRFRMDAPRSEKLRFAGSLLIEKMPLLALSVGSALATLAAQRAGGALASLEGVSAGARIANALVSYVAYLKDLFWPSGLAVFYPFPMAGVPIWKVAGSAALLAAISIVAVQQVRSRPWIVVGWGWYVLTLVPVIGFVSVGMQARADRYTYLPHVGIFLILSIGLSRVASRSPAWKSVAVGTGILSVAASAACTWILLPVWRDSPTLLSRAVAVTDGNFLAEHALALELAETGRVEEAIERARNAVRANPSYADAHRDLGYLLGRAGDTEGAVEHLAEAIRLDPSDGRSFLDLGILYGQIGRHEEALAAIERSVVLDLESWASHNALGVALERAGLRDRAVEAYAEAARLRPDAYEPQLNLGGVLLRMGRHAEARAAFERAVGIRPESAEGHLGLALASLEIGDRDTAERELTRLETIDPERARRLAEALSRGRSRD